MLCVVLMEQQLWTLAEFAPNLAFSPFRRSPYCAPMSSSLAKFVEIQKDEERWERRF